VCKNCKHYYTIEVTKNLIIHRCKKNSGILLFFPIDCNRFEERTGHGDTNKVIDNLRTE
jgi:hypothetical protein